MSVAEHVASILKKYHIQATFFVANEKTKENNFSLDAAWKSYWQERVKEGHAFGSHTLHHTYFQKDGPGDTVIMKSQFGPEAGKTLKMTSSDICKVIEGSNQRFKELTGRNLDPIWRAPGGKTSPKLIANANACGYRHIAWAPAGFLGDELSSEAYPNDVLLNKALTNLKDGDITMAHLGIWSRKDPWAIADLEPLIIGLKEKGFCFSKIKTP